MKIGIYFCACGTNISEKIDPEGVRTRVTNSAGETHFKVVDFLCSEGGQEVFAEDLLVNGIERVVVSACSPREHEGTFMKVLSRSGINPYLFQMVNVREQVAWVTEDRDKATDKASRYIRAAIQRVALHDALEKKEIDICPDVLVIGAGPAGLKTAMSIAQAGRKVVVVEKTPVIGGLPVRYEEIFPNMECGPCMLEPLLGEILHGEHAENIELLTLSEVSEVLGSYGNFTVKVKTQSRYVDTHKCIGCGECIEPCPVSAKNPYNCGLNERKAISFPFAGALPNAPFIDKDICLRLKGEGCNQCKDACPVDDAINFDDEEGTVERSAGAIVIAIGSDAYDCKRLPNLGYGTLQNVCTAVEFERIMASNGPTEGKILTSAGTAPGSVAIIHCVGSLDKDHRDYCSGVCCQYAFKFNHMIRQKLPGTRIHHFFKELSIPGKEEFALYSHAKDSPDTAFFRYEDIAALHIKEAAHGKTVRFVDPDGEEGSVIADMVILCPAVVPAKGAGALGSILEAAQDKFGFFEELHGRIDSAQSKMKGVYLAGTCQSPMDIQKSMSQAMAAAGYILSGLVPGRKLEIKPITASVDRDHCSGCKVCITVCPYKAISFDSEEDVSVVNDVLCQGCGTCVAACPSGAMKGNHFTTQEILAEIEGVLK